MIDKLVRNFFIVVIIIAIPLVFFLGYLTISLSKRTNVKHLDEPIFSTNIIYEYDDIPTHYIAYSVNNYNYHINNVLLRIAIGEKYDVYKHKKSYNTIDDYIRYNETISKEDNRFIISISDEKDLNIELHDYYKNEISYGYGSFYDSYNSEPSGKYKLNCSYQIFKLPKECFNDKEGELYISSYALNNKTGEKTFLSTVKINYEKNDNKIQIIPPADAYYYNDN